MVDPKSVAAGNALVGERRNAGTAVRFYMEGCTGGEEALVWYFPDPKGGKLALPLALKDTAALEYGGIGCRALGRVRFHVGLENCWLVRGYERPDGGLTLVLPEAEKALAYIYWYEFPPREGAP